jgi:hypothetical protein
MKTRNDQEVVALDTKEQHIGKLVDPSPSQGLEHKRKLQRFGYNPLNRAINLGAKATTQPGGFAFIPILRMNEFRPRVRREPKAPHLRASLFEFGLEIFPSDAAIAVLVERCQPTVKFRLLSVGQRYVIVFKTVPQLRDQRQAFIRRQAIDLFRAEFHRIKLCQSR